MKKKRPKPKPYLSPLTWAEAKTLNEKERAEWQKRIDPRVAMQRRFRLAQWKPA